MEAQHSIPLLSHYDMLPEQACTGIALRIVWCGSSILGYLNFTLSTSEIGCILIWCNFCISWSIWIKCQMC